MAAPAVLQIGSFSDGDSTKHPNGRNYSLFSSDVYRQKLGASWAKDKVEQGDNSINSSYKYVLDRLPQGYAVFEKPRSIKPTHKDRYLFGHPRGGVFDSPNKFFPHFLWLMSHNANREAPEACRCVLCDKAPRGSRAPNAAPKPKDRAPGMSDVWRMLFKKLRKEGTIDQELRDPENMELTVTQQVLDEIFAETRKAPAYRHRVGELVLFYDASPDTLVPVVTDAATQKPTILFKWKAGVVCLQNDEENSPLVEEDLFLEKEKRWAITYSGFKVESFPDPRASDLKERITYRTYVPLHQIRPFNYWEEVLADIPRDKWHPTINYAMSVMSSISVFDCFHAKGVWPRTATSCRSIWIGAELIYVGDTVRLKPKQQHDQQITDVLVIDSMTVVGNNKLAQFPDKIHLSGRAFTTNANHKDDGFQKRKVSEQILYTKLPPSMFGRVWYYLHETEEKLVVSLDCVVGRLHGDVAMAAWFDKPGDFDIGLHGLTQGREYSRARYGHTGEAYWYWAQSRAQQLNLKELNEVNLDGSEEDVEPGELRGHMKVLNRHGVDSSALDDGLADSLPESQEQLHGASDGASARAILGGRSLGGFVRKQNLESPRSEGRRSEGGEDSGKELIRKTTEGPPDGEADGLEQTSEDELSAPTVKRLKIGHSLV